MNKKNGIGFLIGTLLVIVLFAFVYRMSYERARQQREAEENVQADAEICYYIMELGGYVTVYEADKKTVFDYTSILVSELPEYLQEDIKEGIKLTSLGQVYGFLENYSS